MEIKDSGEDKVSYFLMTGWNLYYVYDKDWETSRDKFGKTVFREEVEKILEEMKHGQICIAGVMSKTI